MRSPDCAKSVRNSSEVANTLVKPLLGSSDSTDAFFYPNSIFSLVESFSSAPDSELDPGPCINFALSRLVQFLQGYVPSNDSVNQQASYLQNPSLLPTQKDISFAHREREACAIIDANPTLLQRADIIRNVAGRAESRLELFYVRLILQGVQTQQFRNRISQHAGTVEPGLEKTLGKHTFGNPPSSLVPHEEIAIYTNRIQNASKPFPYVDNYIQMVEAEAHILKEMLSPRRMQDCHVVFCGSGPLPLTGLLLAVHLNCRVTLVDNDPQAVILSKALVDEWQKRDILPAGRISVLLSECENISYLPRSEFRNGDGRDETESRDEIMVESHERDDSDNDTIATDDANSSKDSVKSPILPSESNLPMKLYCDVIFIAALVPNDAKEWIARKVAGNSLNGERTPFIVLRSAHGLTARLAYYKTRREILGKHLLHVGTMVPETHSDGSGEVVDDDRMPFAYFPREILNSLEIYGGDEATKNRLAGLK